jgi:hypothetical protein
MSLTAHLTADSAGHGRLAFHPDCPRCRAERLAGSLADDELAARKVAAALAAILAALPAAAPAAVAQTPGGEADRQEPPPSAPPGIGIEVDPGDGSVPDTYTAPTEGGGDDDESEGPPVDTAPADEPVGATPPTEAPAPAPEPTTPSAPEPAEPRRRQRRPRRLHRPRRPRHRPRRRRHPSHQLRRRKRASSSKRPKDERPVARSDRYGSGSSRGPRPRPPAAARPPRRCLLWLRSPSRRSQRIPAPPPRP